MTYTHFLQGEVERRRGGEEEQEDRWKVMSS